MSKRLMMINYVSGEESRIAIVEDGKLEELYQERAGSESHVGNIYKGRVTNVEPAIQAAFVDFGLERNGFLHISDLHPMYFPSDHREELEAVGKKTPRRERPPIQQCLRRGQEILVQVLKEGIGSKGPTLTSYLSIPGRYLVMMPFMERLGVSRKIEDDEQRRVIRKMLDELNPPEGFGFIIRTAGLDRTKTDLKRDLAYLQRLWKAIEKRRNQIRVGELYAESDLVIRTLRDVYSSDIEKVIVDDVDAARAAAEFLAISNPRSGSSVMVYKESIPLFHRYDIERQIENIHAREVPLPSGGSLVIEATEALVAVDVNSGRMRNNSDAETTAFRTNVEACDEICRQLRLRDLGGVVVLDLIDMRQSKNRRSIEQRFRENLKKDRARTRALAISQFGIMELTRQRMRPSLQRSVYVECAACRGEGQVKSPESVVLDVMRQLALAMQPKQATRIELTVSPDVAFLLLNQKRAALVQLEKAFDKPVIVRVNGSGPIDFIQVRATDDRGGEIAPPRLSDFPKPELESIENVVDAAEDDLDDVDQAPETEPQSTSSASATEADPSETADSDVASEEQTESAPKKKRRRRRRRGRGKGQSGETQEQGDQPLADGQAGADAQPLDVDDTAEANADQEPDVASHAADGEQLSDAASTFDPDPAAPPQPQTAATLSLERPQGTAALAKAQPSTAAEPPEAASDRHPHTDANVDRSAGQNPPAAAVSGSPATPSQAPPAARTPQRSRLMQHRKPANRLVSIDSPPTPTPGMAPGSSSGIAAGTASGATGRHGAPARSGTSGGSGPSGREGTPKDGGTSEPDRASGTSGGKKASGAGDDRRPSEQTSQKSAASESSGGQQAGAAEPPSVAPVAVDDSADGRPASDDQVADASEADAPPRKAAPRRRKRSRKKAQPVAAEQAEAVEVPPPQSTQDAPKKSGRSRKKAKTAKKTDSAAGSGSDGNAPTAPAGTGYRNTMRGDTAATQAEPAEVN